MDQQAADAAQERAAGEASTSAGPSNSTNAKDKPIIVLIIGECASLLYCCRQQSSNRRVLHRLVGTAMLHKTTSKPQVSASQHRVSCFAGMAGSGKTTLIQRINSHMHQHKLPGYIINLDPAVTHLPYGANIDIRDTVRHTGRASIKPQQQPGRASHT